MEGKVVFVWSVFYVNATKKLVGMAPILLVMIAEIRDVYLIIGSVFN